MHRIAAVALLAAGACSGETISSAWVGYYKGATEIYGAAFNDNEFNPIDPETVDATFAFTTPGERRIGRMLGVVRIFQDVLDPQPVMLTVGGTQYFSQWQMGKYWEIDTLCWLGEPFTVTVYLPFDGKVGSVSTYIGLMFLEGTDYWGGIVETQPWTGELPTYPTPEPATWILAAGSLGLLYAQRHRIARRKHVA